MITWDHWCYLFYKNESLKSIRCKSKRTQGCLENSQSQSKLNFSKELKENLHKVVTPIAMSQLQNVI